MFLCMQWNYLHPYNIILLFHLILVLHNHTKSHTVYILVKISRDIPCIFGKNSWWNSGKYSEIIIRDTWIRFLEQVQNDIWWSKDTFIKFQKQPFTYIFQNRRSYTLRNKHKEPPALNCFLIKLQACNLAYWKSGTQDPQVEAYGGTLWWEPQVVP